MSRSLPDSPIILTLFSLLLDRDDAYLYADGWLLEVE